jgi:hypothetical protein
MVAGQLWDAAGDDAETMTCDPCELMIVKLDEQMHQAGDCDVHEWNELARARVAMDHWRAVFLRGDRAEYVQAKKYVQMIGTVY